MTLSPCSSRRVPLHLIIERGYLRLQVATEYDVSTSTGHVGSNRHDAWTTGLRNNFSFLLVVLCVEHFVVDARFLEESRELFGGLY